MIIDGKVIAGEILARTKVRAKALGHAPRVVAIVSSETPATKSYLKIKEARAGDAGCVFESRPLGASFEDADAVIIQLPLPDGTNTKEILDTIPLEKDADVLGSAARMLFEDDEIDTLLPPVVGAIKEILAFGKVELRGKSAVVVGEGWLVGAPAATWLRHEGVEVEVCNDKTSPPDLVEALRAADIIVSGAGSPGLIKPEMLKEAVVLIDAGASESTGKLAGDADPACASHCSIFTPVPGGVGPVAVAKLFENAIILTERKVSK